ncbi:MFS transporter [Candidatus Parvarchaeota archaeon]|nr:MFS transporter [Candidatus Parvarchaeota archaeon]
MKYKWTVLANTTMGGMMASINATIILISLPSIFRGLDVNPLSPGNFTLLLWVILGYMVVTAAFLVSFGRLSDDRGRKKFYTVGFSVFAAASIALSLVPYGSGVDGVLFIIIFRLIQGVGGGFIMVNSTALLTDAFPDNERGKALGINQVSFLSGSFIGLVIGGLLSPFDFHLIFIVSVPVALLGALWSFFKLKEEKIKKRAGVDYIGNAALSIGLVLIALGFTYTLTPYGGQPLGWSNPFVIGSLLAGVVMLLAFYKIERKAENPIFDLELLRNRQFSFSSLALFLSALARGAVMFLVIIWLQGVYLPLHGFTIAQTPFWAGIYMIPLMVGFIALGPISGILTDRYGARVFSTLGLVITALGLFLLTLLPANFNYVVFALILFIIGSGNGLFAAPNTKRAMDALPWWQRGVGNGVRTTFANIGQMISLVVFFTIAITIFSVSLPHVIVSQGSSLGLPQNLTSDLASVPASSFLFSAFLGINPVTSFLASAPKQVVSSIPVSSLNTITSSRFIPALISAPFLNGLDIAMYIGIAISLIGAALSAMTRHRTNKDAQKYQR